MIPKTLRRNLGSLRRRERFLDLAWGAARWLALAVVLLLAACLIDWAVDREQDTPEALRQFLSYFQVAAALVAGFAFILWPLRKRLADSVLTLRVEDKYPHLHHRLISAVQLNRPGAVTEGMSAELIGVVTDEAVRHAEKLDFAGVADTRRLRWSVALVLPAVVCAVVPILLWPDIAQALLARQLGDDQDIPRNVSIEAITTEPWASGEKGVLKFTVRGKNLDELTGVAVVRPDGLPRDRYPLELDRSWNQGEEAIFFAELPPSSTSFTYTAWLGDGRTKKPARVRYVPRPVVIEQTAWVVLPEFCGVRPDGSRYELPQGRGDVQGIAGSAARVAVKIQKPIQAGRLELLGPHKLDPEQSPEEMGPEVVKRSIPLEAGPDGTWQGTFALSPEETGYRVVVTDEHGFANVPPPRRHLRLVPEEAPQVALLKEQFPPTLRAFLATHADDFVVEGLPLPLGGSIPIGYTASGAYGLGQARLLYRVVKKVESGNDDPGDEKWVPLPLQEYPGTEKDGAFDPRIGAFEHSRPKDQVFFHAIPDGTPLPRTLGGGRFDFKTTGIPDGKGGLLTLKVGDQIEYCIEIFADRNGGPTRPSARSETRVKTIVTFVELERWLAENLQEAQRIRQLDSKQRGLFGEK